MSALEKDELLTALLHVFPEAEVRHFDNLVRRVEEQKLDHLTVNHIIELTQQGMVKIPK